MIDNVLSVTLTNKKATITNEINFLEGCKGSSKISIDLRNDGKRPTLSSESDEFSLCCLGEKEEAVTIQIPKESFTIETDNMLTCALTEEILSKPDKYKAHLEWVNGTDKAIFPTFNFVIEDVFCND